MTPKPTAIQSIAAWSVHAFTASGAVLGVMALQEIEHKHWRIFFVLLAAAVAIDAFDGTLARWFRVKERVPSIDGALLDNIVDYFTYVLVPAAFVLQGGYFTEAGSFAAAAMMAISSAYQFAQVDAKTDDHYFKGWPSYWNIVVLYIVLLGPSPEACFRIVLFFTVLVFVPVKYLYPSRTTRLRVPTLLFSILWAIAMLVLIVQLPNPSMWLVWTSLLFVVYYIAASFWITIRMEKNAW
jgi:phosphatidylcholine synthase